MAIYFNNIGYDVTYSVSYSDGRQPYQGNGRLPIVSGTKGLDKAYENAVASLRYISGISIPSIYREGGNASQTIKINLEKGYLQIVEEISTNDQGTTIGFSYSLYNENNQFVEGTITSTRPSTEEIPFINQRGDFEYSGSGNWTINPIIIKEKNNEYMGLYAQHIGSDSDYQNGISYATDGFNISTYTQGLSESGSFPGSTSDAEGGEGAFDDSSDDITDDSEELQNLYEENIAQSMYSVYKPSKNDLKDLSSWLWSKGFFDSVIKNYASPMENIVALHTLPFEISTSGSKGVKVGGVDSTLVFPVPSKAYQSIDMGSIPIREYWGSFLDYSPYTKIKIYLPYIGLHELNTDLVMNATISLKYKVEIKTGAFICTLRVVKEGLNADIYNFSGNMANSIPLSASNFAQLNANYLSTAVGVISGVGGGAPMLVNNAINVLNTKPSYSNSGNFGGNFGYLMNQTPYIIIERAIQQMPKRYAHEYGFPSFITTKLSECKGYTKVSELHLDNLNCSLEEKEEIESLLKNGIII